MNTRTQPPLRRRRKVRRRLSLNAGAVQWAGTAVDGAFTPPGFAPVESRRAAFVSGLLAAGIHASVLGSLAVLAWLAPEIVEDVIVPVKLIDAPVPLPGSNRPQILAARPSIRATALVPQPTLTPQSLRPTPAAISPEALRAAEIEAMRAPARIDPRELSAARLETAALQPADALAPIDAATLRPVEISPSGLRAPALDLDTPRVIAPGKPVAISAREAFRGLEHISQESYTGTAIAPAPSATFAVDDAGIDPELAGAWLGGGAGVVGPEARSGANAVPCLQSAFVVRYINRMKERTYARWRVPEGTPTNERVVLRFRLDAWGSATDVAVVDANDPRLGRSAVLALRSASPFPPMDDNVRCLAERRLTGTFDIPPL